jgi:phospholipid/cholesterol/gamma-HCH transport system substrate-binding protein
VRIKFSVRLVAVAAVAVAGATGATTAVAGHDSPDGMMLSATFTDASPLLVGNDVKVNGVRVGEITDMFLTDGTTRVVMALDTAVLPVHSDATATVRPVSLLGERYVDLDRGSPQAQVLSSGAVLPATQTGRASDLDELLNTVDDPTGRSLAALVTMLGDGAKGNGEELAAAIKTLEPAMTKTDALTTLLTEQNDVLGQLVDALTPVAQALAADNGRSLDSLVESASQLLGTTAANQQAFEETLARLPDTLAAARQTLAELTGTANAATPVLADIRPATDNLSAISDEISRFTDVADPALAKANPVLAKAQRLLAEARPVVAALSAAGPALSKDIESARPVVEALAGNLDNVMNFIRFWALATNGRDGLGHYFRGLAIVNPQTLTGLLPGAGDLGVPDLLGGQARPPALPALPGLDGLPLGGLLSPRTSADGGVTGLNEEQETGLLGTLLGGL